MKPNTCDFVSFKKQDMETPIGNQEQPKVTGGTQKVIRDEHDTKETDHLDPNFSQEGTNSEDASAKHPAAER